LTDYAYAGTELPLFALADNWKAYFRRHIRPFLSDRVLEVGAGIGATMQTLCDGTQASWTALEPDPDQATQLEAAAAKIPGPCSVEVRKGTTESLGGAAPFDCILYVDVLEHIEDDARELERAACLLAPGGAVVVLAPAHQALFSPFDAEIGHLRRYSKTSLSALTPSSLRMERCRYLDSVGVCASFANRACLRSSMPTRRQILFWDRVMIPLSRCLDPLFAYRLGKSVLAVWRET